MKISRWKKPEKSYDEMVAELHAYEALEKEGYFDDLKKLNEMNIMTVHYREKPTEKQKYHIWTIPLFNIALMRNLKARAIPPYPVAARLMTDKEVEDHKHLPRAVYYGWITWGRLLEHESQSFPDPNWEKLINELSKMYPCTKDTAIGKHGQIKLLF